MYVYPTSSYPAKLDGSLRSCLNPVLMISSMPLIMAESIAPHTLDSLACRGPLTSSLLFNSVLSCVTILPR